MTDTQWSAHALTNRRKIGHGTYAAISTARRSEISRLDCRENRTFRAAHAFKTGAMRERRNHLSVVTVGTRPADHCQPLTARTDDELMLLTRAGVRAAFDTLVRRHQRRVLLSAARLVGRWSLAPDVVQEHFAVYRRLNATKPCGKFVPYLAQVLLNQCRMARRSVRHVTMPTSRVPRAGRACASGRCAGPRARTAAGVCSRPWTL